MMKITKKQKQAKWGKWWAWSRNFSQMTSNSHFYTKASKKTHKSIKVLLMKLYLALKSKTQKSQKQDKQSNFWPFLWNLEASRTKTKKNFGDSNSWRWWFFICYFCVITSLLIVKYVFIWLLVPLKLLEKSQSFSASKKSFKFGRSKMYFWEFFSPSQLELSLTYCLRLSGTCIQFPKNSQPLIKSYRFRTVTETRDRIVSQLRPNLVFVCCYVFQLHTQGHDEYLLCLFSLALRLGGDWAKF